jgi:hypothetical protein
MISLPICKCGGLGLRMGADYICEKCGANVYGMTDLYTLDEALAELSKKREDQTSVWTHDSTRLPTYEERYTGDEIRLLSPLYDEEKR